MFIVSDIMELVAANALGIGAASFWSAAEKDRAESPTAIAGTPKERLKSKGKGLKFLS